MMLFVDKIELDQPVQTMKIRVPEPEWEMRRSSSRSSLPPQMEKVKP